MRSFLASIGILLVLPLFLRAGDSPTKEDFHYVAPKGVTQNTRIKATWPRTSIDDRLKDLELVVLCPEHTGLTVHEEPSIFWYLSKAVPGVQYKLTVTTDNEPDPLLEKDLDPMKNTGIQRLNLKEIPRKLATNTEYTISVAIIPSPTERAKDLVTRGNIRRVAPPEKLIAKLLTRPTPAEKATVYAGQGFFYDALTAISDQIAMEPRNASLREKRSKLLKDVGLSEVNDQ